MRRWLVVLALLLSTLVLLARSVENPSNSSGNLQAERTQSATPLAPITEAPPGHCPGASHPDKVSGGRLIHKVNPQYPAELRKAHVEGTVVVCATVGKDGKLHDLQALSGPAELVPYAKQALEQWRYKPFRVNEELVEMNSEIRLDFKLSQ